MIRNNIQKEINFKEAKFYDNDNLKGIITKL